METLLFIVTLECYQTKTVIHNPPFIRKNISIIPNNTRCSTNILPSGWPATDVCGPWPCTSLWLTGIQYWTKHCIRRTLAQLYPYHGTMAPWHHGIMTTWYQEIIAKVANSGVHGCGGTKIFVRLSPKCVWFSKIEVGHVKIANKSDSTVNKRLREEELFLNFLLINLVCKKKYT